MTIERIRAIVQKADQAEAELSMLSTIKKGDSFITKLGKMILRRHYFYGYGNISAAAYQEVKKILKEEEEPPTPTASPQRS